jgi:streptogramin lyase
MSTQSVQLFGKDADGNTILGPGAPVVSLASNDSTHLAISAMPGSNTFTLSRPAIPSAKSVVTLTATVQPLAGAASSALTSHVNVTFDGTICGVLKEFSTGIVSGAIPKYIAAGPDGNMWFTERQSGKLGRITPAGTITEFSVDSASAPNGIATGPDGNLWFAEQLTSVIGKSTTSGTNPVQRGYKSGCLSDRHHSRC